MIVPYHNHRGHDLLHRQFGQPPFAGLQFVAIASAATTTRRGL